MLTTLTAVRYHHGNNRPASQWLSITVTVLSSCWNVNKIDGCPLAPWQQQTGEPMTVDHCNGFLVMLKCQQNWRLSATTMATRDRPANDCQSQAAFEKSCRLIRLIWSPLLPFVYSILSIRSIWICVRLLHRDYSEHDLSARSPDFERSDQCGSN